MSVTPERRLEGKGSIITGAGQGLGRVTAELFARHGARVVDLPEDAWDRVLAVNLTGPFLCTKYVAAQMRLQGSGSIVNVSSLSGLMAHENQADYNASKHGLIGLTRCTAQDCGRFGIRANAVCPGAMNTPMMQIRPRANVAATAAQSAFGRWAEPIEVARAIVFLASDEASFITGATLTVDGGVSSMQPSTSQLLTGIDAFMSASDTGASL